MFYRKFIKFVGNLPLFVSHPMAFFYRKEYIFMLSHMRSRSSLLSHILGSHSDITGYVELQRSYEDWIDILNLRRKLYQMHDKQLNTKYLFDKILHNSHLLDDSVLGRDNFKIIVLLRKPEESIKSIISLGYLTDYDDYKKHEFAANYYCERVDYLSSLNETIKRKCFYIESDRIINDSENLLNGMSDWLELESKLDSKYDTFKLTGKPVFGDPSENIKEGKIKKITDSNSDILIDPKLLIAPNESYERCHNIFNKM